MPVRPDNYNGALDKAGDHRRDGRADDTHDRRAKLAEDEDIVADEVHKHRDDTGLHGHQRLSALLEGACIHLLERKGRDLDKHDGEIILAVIERRGHVKLLLALVDELHDELFSEEQEHNNERSRRERRYVELCAESIGNTLAVVLPVVLRGEYARAGEPAEYTEVKNKNKLVDYRHAGHRLRTDLTDHDVIKQAYKVRYNVLHQYRQHDGKELSVKGLTADKPVELQIILSVPRVSIKSASGFPDAGFMFPYLSSFFFSSSLDSNFFIMSASMSGRLSRASKSISSLS